MSIHARYNRKTSPGSPRFPSRRVSRAIHMPEKVANSTRLKVNQAIAITGYATNAVAQPAARSLQHDLVVALDIGDPNFFNILIGLENEARAMATVSDRPYAK